MRACHFENVPLIKLLLAQPRIDLMIQDKYRWNALHYAQKTRGGLWRLGV